MNKLYYAINIIKSCIKTEQMAFAILWAAKVIDKKDMYKLVHICETIPGSDLAVQMAKEIYISRI